VKAVRLWLLVLLAVLLPIRGAVAAAMLCPVGSSGMQSELRMQEHAAGHEAMDAGTAHAHGGHGHGHEQGHNHANDHGDAAADHHDDEQAQGASDKCNTCSAYCSLTPMVSELSRLPEPTDSVAIKFPDLSFSAPTFLSDGQERPPRAI